MVAPVARATLFWSVFLYTHTYIHTSVKGLLRELRRICMYGAPDQSAEGGDAGFQEVVLG